MLKQHKFYVYYDGNQVMARAEGEKPIVAETFDTPQEAHDRVQEIVNPRGLSPSALGPKGFHESAFQDAISGHSEAYVKAAYLRVKRAKKRADKD